MMIESKVLIGVQNSHTRIMMHIAKLVEMDEPVTLPVMV